MAISADDRDELRRLAQATWGDRGADLLMAGLAEADLRATEERLGLRIDLVRSELRGEFHQFREEIRSELSEFRGEVRGEIGQLRGEMGELRGQIGELRGEIGELRGEFGKLQGYVGMELGAIRSEIGAQNRLFLFSIVACFAAVAATVFGALQLVA